MNLRTRGLSPAILTSCVLLLSRPAVLPAQPADPGLPRLEREIARISSGFQGTVGVAAVHIETGRTVVVKRGERFPMASVRKLPVALQLLALVDAGKERLDRTIDLQPTDLRPGGGTISNLFDDPGVRLPLRTLLELMLVVSDNSATDVVVRVAGGPQAIQANLRRLGVDGVRFDRPVIETHAAYAGVTLPPEPITPARFQELTSAVSPEARTKAEAAFASDPRDTSTPEGMAALLARLWKGELLSPASTSLLLDIMKRCETGPARIKGLLRPDVTVRHKTGTMGRSTNDVGIVELPGNAGHVALAVFVKDATGTTEQSERAIAHVSRAVHDYFTFRPTGESGSLSALEDELSRVAPAAQGTFGVTAVHLESGRRASVNRTVGFPMASSVKVAIAHRLLERVDRGELALDTMVPISPGDLHPGSGTLTSLFDEPGVALSLRNYLELMMLISDNSATDVLLRQAGGPAAVTESVRRLGVEGLRVDRSTLRLIADWLGVTTIPESEQVSNAWFDDLLSKVSEEERRRRATLFDGDPRDTSTPDAMAGLLEAVWKGSGLRPSSRDLLVDIMRRCETGEARLKGLLPAGTVVAHKTGTIGGTTNDVGIVYLPDDAGHVVVAAFVKESRVEVPARERVIAHAARAIYDFFLFSPEVSAR